jgi:methylenetetrahydrofolate--tRNA-(uracil-5-)-methyltransferase
MKTVTRVNITEAIYEKIGLSRKDSGDVLDMVIDEIRNELSAGNDVKITSFGTFSLRKKNARIGRNPRTGKEDWAVVQLRQDNCDGTLYNMVGFQTHLKWGEQRRVFSMIPALRNAEFVRYGVMHRNTFLSSPGRLDRYYRLIADPRIRFAGQITGVEGYVESAASGLLVGIETAAEIHGQPAVDFPQETAIGALGLYISQGSIGDFQPMNINFGIIKSLDYRVKGKRNKNAEISRRSLEILDELLKKEVFQI